VIPFAFCGVFRQETLCCESRQLNNKFAVRHRHLWRARGRHNRSSSIRHQMCFQCEWHCAGQLLRFLLNFRIDGAGLYAGTNYCPCMQPVCRRRGFDGARCLPAAVFSPSLARVETCAACVWEMGASSMTCWAEKSGCFDRVSFERSNLVNGLYVVLAGSAEGRKRSCVSSDEGKELKYPL